MAAMTVKAAARVLGVAVDAEETEIRRRYREEARGCHPDKTQDDTSEKFLQLQEALHVLLSSAPQKASSAGASTERKAEGMRESERLDKHFCGTHFGSDNFDPRAWSGIASDEALKRGHAVQVVWRCKLCPEESSVCCRLKPKKHSCLCGHKVEAHSQEHGFRCMVKGCRCPKLQFHVQQLGWEARCACKHHVKDHAQAEGPPYRCTKILPGKDKRPCPCAGFHVSWVCTCGHSWDAHETTWQEGVSKAVFAREWVAQGLRPECVAEAEEKRNKWSSEAATLAAQHGEQEALRIIQERSRRMQVSMCAEARMKEAVEDTLDGSRLPAPAPKPLPDEPPKPKDKPPIRPSIISNRSNSAPSGAGGRRPPQPIDNLRALPQQRAKTDTKEALQKSGYANSRESVGQRERATIQQARRSNVCSAPVGRSGVAARNGSGNTVASQRLEAREQSGAMEEATKDFRHKGDIFVNVTVDATTLTSSDALSRQS